MRIAQVSPLYESVPPRQYGGTERVVSYLTEELVRQGHEVTLFASGDSITNATLCGVGQAATRLDARCMDPLSRHILLAEQVWARAAEFDIIHFHIDYLHFPLVRRSRTATLTTLHGRLDIPDLALLYQEFCDIPLASISDAQRTPLPWVNWQGTVYHGLPEGLYRFDPRPGDYLAFLGRICPEKRVDRAIEIARRVGMPLRIAAKVDRADRDYYRNQIAPLLNDPRVEFLGEIGETEKVEFLRNAYALLFPIDWPEPFGLVMIEAMASGLPVIAYRCGSVPEIITDGVTGYIVDTLNDAVSAVEKVAGLDRRLCRRVFEERFSVTRMASDYVAIYQRQLQGELANVPQAG